MGSTHRVLFAVALAASLAAHAQTDVYRWVDKDGKVHFSDSPPPADASGVTQKRMGGGPAPDVQLPYATQVAMRRHPVVLYTSNTCGDICRTARELLENRGIPFTERNAQANAADAEALKALTGALQVPVLAVGESTLKGYAEDGWHSALDAAGYPRTRLPGQRSPAVPPQ